MASTIYPTSVETSKQEILQHAHQELQQLESESAAEQASNESAFALPARGGFNPWTTVLTLVGFVLACTLIVLLASHSQKATHANASVPATQSNAAH